MSTRALIVSGAAAALTSASLAGQAMRSTPQGPYFDAARGISLDQAVAQALEREPTLRAARTEVEAARGLRLQAGLRPNPKLSFERRDEPAGTDNQTSVAVEWPLDLFRKSGRVAVADRNLEVATYSVEDRKRTLAADVRTAYGQVLTAVRDVTVSDELVAAIRRQLEVVRARVGEGATPPLERDLLDVEVRRLEADRLTTMARADMAVIELKRVMGLDPASPLSVRETLEDVVLGERTTTAAPVQPDSMAERADVREAEMRERLAAARVDRARREGRADMSLVGSYMRMDAGFPQRGFAPDGALRRVRGLFHYTAVGAMVTVPLRNRNQGEIAALEADRAGAQARHEAVHLAARAELAAAQARDASAQRAVAVYASDARQLARQNLTVVRQTYELGRATVFDVLAEQRRFLDFERAYTSVLHEAYDARTALKRATGDLR
jgi:cobalt-zinc-cadmium efflux system outer membrane protein